MSCNNRFVWEIQWSQVNIVSLVLRRKKIYTQSSTTYCSIWRHFMRIFYCHFKRKLRIPHEVKLFWFISTDERLDLMIIRQCTIISIFQLMKMKWNWIISSTLWKCSQRYSNSEFQKVRHILRQWTRIKNSIRIYRFNDESSTSVFPVWTVNDL